MKRNAILMGLLAIFAVGCARGPAAMREIYFYHTAETNPPPQLLYAIDVIYPQDKAELDKVLEIGPQKWFTSDLFDRVHKDKGEVNVDQDVSHVTLKKKVKDDAYVVIFVEFNKPDQNPPRGRAAYVLYTDLTRPKAYKVEYIAIHDGSLERLAKKPKPIGH